MIPFGGSEVDGCLSNLLHSSQANLTILTREIHNLWQCVEARDGQPAEGLNHIEQELQNIFLMLRMQLTSTPAPSEPFRQVIY